MNLYISHPQVGDGFRFISLQVCKDISSVVSAHMTLQPTAKCFVKIEVVNAFFFFFPPSSNTSDHKDSSDKKHREKEKMKHKDGSTDKHKDKHKDKDKRDKVKN